jgi:hypothetical protein
MAIDGVRGDGLRTLRDAAWARDGELYFLAVMLADKLQ